MLVLTRRVGESIRIGNDIEVMVTRTFEDGSVRLGISAPTHVAIRRKELTVPKAGELPCVHRNGDE
jgi:carbon storage regulator